MVGVPKASPLPLLVNATEAAGTGLPNESTAVAVRLAVATLSATIEVGEAVSDDCAMVGAPGTNVAGALSDMVPA